MDAIPPPSPSSRPTTFGVREALLEQTIAMIDSSGVEELSIKSVCESVGVSPSLANYYFTGRGGLISCVITRALDDLRIRQRHDDPRATPEERLAHALSASVEWAAAHPSLLAAVVLRFSDSFSTDAPEAITRDLHRAWCDIEHECALLANSFIDGEPVHARGLHLLWVLLGSVAWLTFPTLGTNSHEIARAHLPMSPAALLAMLHRAFASPVAVTEWAHDEEDDDSPTSRSTRESLIRITAGLLRTSDGRSTSARTVCEIAGCAPSLVTYHFGTFESLVAHAATHVFVTASQRAAEKGLSHLPADQRLGDWLWIVARSASGSLALPIALGSTVHRSRLRNYGPHDLEENLKNAWVDVIGSTAHLAAAVLQSEAQTWTGRLEEFVADAPLLETMSFIGLTGLGASLWMCSTQTHSTLTEVDETLSTTIPIAVQHIINAASRHRTSDQR